MNYLQAKKLIEKKLNRSFGSKEGHITRKVNRLNLLLKTNKK